MTKWVALTADGKTVDVVFLYDPRPGIDAIEVSDDVFHGYVLADDGWMAPTTIGDQRAAKIAAIAAVTETFLAAGAPVEGGLHIALDDGSRSDLIALAQTASNAMSGVLSWPESYSRGWITIENVRIPLATPAAGLMLAASVGDYYAAIVQHRRDLKDAALAAEDAAALDAIDETAGWPE